MAGLGGREDRPLFVSAFMPSVALTVQKTSYSTEGVKDSRELVQAMLAGVSLSYSKSSTVSYTDQRIALTVQADLNPQPLTLNLTLTIITTMQELAVLDRCPIGRWGPYRRVANAKDGVAELSPWLTTQLHRREGLVAGARSFNSIKARMGALQVIFNEGCVWGVAEFLLSPFPLLDFIESQQATNPNPNPNPNCLISSSRNRQLHVFEASADAS